MPAWPTSVATDATLHLAKNLLSTTLNGDITDSTTTVILTDASNFPTAGFVVIDSEIIKYTDKSADTLIGVTRGADSSTAAAHTSGAFVFQFFVAAWHNDMKDELIAVENSLNLTVSRAIVTNGAGRLAAATTTAAEIGFVNGVTSGIQTQLDTKATDSLVVHLAGEETITGAKEFSDTPNCLAGLHSQDQITVQNAAGFLVAPGSGKVLLVNIAVNDQIQIEGGGRLDFNHAGITPVTWTFTDGKVGINQAIPATALDIVGDTTFSSLTATTVPYLDGSKILTSSGVTPTELGYLSGVTSALQTQIDAKANDADVVHLTGDHTITGENEFQGPTFCAGGLVVTIALDLGASGLPTPLNLYSPVGGGGKTTFSMNNNTGAATTTFSFAAQAGARTYTVPDAGATTSFVMAAGSQTIAGTKTFSGGITISGGLFIVQNDSIIISTAQSPASNGTGTTGELAWDSDFLYICVATNTWKRVAMTGGY